MRTLAHIRQLARRAARQNALETFDLTAAVRAAQLRDVPPSLWDELHSHLDHNPALGLALARTLHAVSRRARKPRLRATADLALMRALNVCGEFYQAAQLSAAAARRFEKLGDAENVARVWFEAAWAETYLGNLEAAENYLERAQIQNLSAAQWTAQRDWLRARILRERGNYAEACELFSRVRAFYLAQRAQPAAQRALREIGHTRARMNPSAALKPLRAARAFFRRAHYPLECALCDYYLAQALMDLNRFGQAEAHLRQAQTVFRAHAARFFDGYCDIDFGYLAWLVDDPARMLEFSRNGYAVFTPLYAVQELATCQINIGVALMELNRYDEAIPFFEDAFRQSDAGGRRLKAANCLLNLARIFATQGQYAQALQRLQRARDIFRRAANTELTIRCELRLANVYLQLNDLKQTHASIAAAYRLAQREKMSTHLAQCELYRAQLFMRRGETHKATAALRRARLYFARNKQLSHVAWCDRLLGEMPSSRRKTAHARLLQSRARFRQQRQFVDVALCDLALAELALRWRAWRQAVPALTRAERALQDAFPEPQARMLYARGRIAQAKAQARRALEYFIQAAQTLARVRRALGVDTLSDSFARTRLQVIHAGLDLARRLDAPAAALALIEAAKAQTFAQQLAAQAWRAPQAEAHGQDLAQREHALYRQITQARQTLALRIDSEDAAPQRSSAARLRALKALMAEHARVAQELGLARPSFAGVPVLDPFALDALRAAASKNWGDRWLALDYFFDATRLYIVSVDQTQVRMDVRPWGWAEKQLLAQATHLHPDMRELVFNGTLHGRRIAARENILARLGELVLPPRAQELTHGALLIAPHQLLHQLAFQALQIDGTFLAERVQVAYTPTLQGYAQLCQNAAANERAASDTLFVCGVKTFAHDDLARNLPTLRHTRREVNQIRRQYPSATVLWQSRAQRARLLEWNQTERLRDFSILHFATHATLYADTPQLGAIELSQDALTFLDITNLHLNARLVTLSACAGNLGRGGSGDEWVSLARAFFYAGARALVASLWEVDDESTTKLMELFYKGLARGESIAAALAFAQRERMRQGASPLQWAPFVAIGNV